MPFWRQRRLLRYVLRQWPSLLAIFGFSAAASAAAALIPWPTKILVDHTLGHAAVPGALRVALAGVGLAASPRVLVVTAALVSLGLFALSNLLDLGLHWSWTNA